MSAPWFLLSYWALYVTILMIGLRKRLQAEMPRWLFPFEVIGYALAAAGLFVYAIGQSLSSINQVWKAAFGLILVVSILGVAFDYRHLVRTPDPRVTERESRVFSAISCVTTFLFQLPCLWINFRLAFG